MTSFFLCYSKELGTLVCILQVVCWVRRRPLSSRFPSENYLDNNRFSPSQSSSVRYFSVSHQRSCIICSNLRSTSEVSIFSPASERLKMTAYIFFYLCVIARSSVSFSSAYFLRSAEYADGHHLLQSRQKIILITTISRSSIVPASGSSLSLIERSCIICSNLGSTSEVSIFSPASERLKMTTY